MMRAKVEIETKANGRETIIVHELPFQVNKARLIERIAELVRDKKIDGITDLRDESDRNRYENRHGSAKRCDMPMSF